MKVRHKAKKLIFKVMKYRKLKIIMSAIFVIAASCNDPEAIVTDIVHPDGSITRKIEIKNSQNNFKVSEMQVPFDSTWVVRDSIEISEKGDTLWVKRAEKLFKNIAEINRDYESDSSYNSAITRNAALSKKFRWFHTGYRFSETIDKELENGYPVKNFLNQEELAWFYSPDNVKQKKETSSDSLNFKALNDSVTKKTDLWVTRSVVSEWTGEFVNLTNGRAGVDLSAESLKSRENEFVKLIQDYDNKFDSLWAQGLILKKLIGEENASKFKAEADSALAIVEEKFLVSFRDYALRISMPGKVTGSNGFIDSSQLLMWPVKSDFFLTDPYEMWAESKVPNRWAWIVSGLFVLFVFLGIMFTRKGKG